MTQRARGFEGSAAPRRKRFPWDFAFSAAWLISTRARSESEHSSARRAPPPPRAMRATPGCAVAVVVTHPPGAPGAGGGGTYAHPPIRPPRPAARARGVCQLRSSPSPPPRSAPLPAWRLRPRLESPRSRTLRWPRARGRPALTPLLPPAGLLLQPRGAARLFVSGREAAPARAARRRRRAAARRRRP